MNQENGGSQVTNGFNVAARKYWTPDNPTNDYCRLNAAGPNTGLANGVDKVYNRSFVRLDDITLTASVLLQVVKTSAPLIIGNMVIPKLADWLHAL